jgi:hypothetical protein
MKNPVDGFDIERIYRLYEAQDYKNCLKLVKKVSERLGCMTGWLHWVSGVCQDIEGNPFDGLLHFKQALLADPTNYGYMTSLGANLDVFRHNLTQYLDGDGTLDDIQKIHKLLVDAGEFNSTLQYLVVRNYLVRDQYKLARDLIEVYLISNPNDQEALALEMVIENRLGTALAN